MSMSSSSGTANAVSEINVTPLIDVLLVLLIIFMVIVPLAPKGLDSSIPQPAKDPSAESALQTIVVEVRANSVGEPTYKINETAFAKSDVEPRLAAIFAMRRDKVMFVQADAGLEFSKVAEVVDMGHQADVQSIGLITPRIAAAQ
jgi:biopolymer transport protein TolR